MDLGGELRRTGLDVRVRLLAIAVAAVLPADWPRLCAAAAAARDAGHRRTELTEALLQAVLFFGFPRVIAAFEQLAAVWPAPDADAAAAAAPGVPAQDQLREGERVFAAVYGTNEQPVRAKLRALHPELHDFVLQAAYGRILARPGLDLATRELLAVTALAALQQRPQLVAHARGALACGATRDAIREAIVTGGRDEAFADDLLRAVRPRPER